MLGNVPPMTIVNSPPLRNAKLNTQPTLAVSYRGTRVAAPSLTPRTQAEMLGDVLKSTEY